MNRIWLWIALVTCCFKSNAQTTVPFYGFELSNYEVGDTLEYVKTLVYPSPTDYLDKWILVIIDKQQLDSTSIIYTIKYIKSNKVLSSGYVASELITSGTAQGVISNDVVYGNQNNLLGVSLNPYVCFIPAGCTLSYDTINGQKQLEMKGFNGSWTWYRALQNVGVLFYEKSSSAPQSTETTRLIYARLQHYGVYGTYQPIVDSSQFQTDTTQNQTPVDTLGNDSLPSIYFDPVSKILYIKKDVENSFAELSIVDVLGREVLSISIDDEKHLNLGALRSGIYLYSITGHQPLSGKLWIR